MMRRSHDEILHERARLLARVPEAPPDETSILVIVFSLGEHRYAMEARYVREIRKLENLTPVPCTPDFVAGIVNIRGALFSLVDLREVLGLPRRGVTDLTEIMVVNAGGLEVGVLAHEVLDLVALPESSIKPPLARDDKVKRELVRGITSDLVTVLNIDKLMRDPEMVVHEEVMG